MDNKRKFFCTVVYFFCVIGFSSSIGWSSSFPDVPLIDKDTRFNIALSIIRNDNATDLEYQAATKEMESLAVHEAYPTALELLWNKQRPEEQKNFIINFLSEDCAPQSFSFIGRIIHQENRLDGNYVSDLYVLAAQDPEGAKITPRITYCIGLAYSAINADQPFDIYLSSLNTSWDMLTGVTFDPQQWRAGFGNFDDMNSYSVHAYHPLIRRIKETRNEDLLVRCRNFLQTIGSEKDHWQARELLRKFN